MKECRKDILKQSIEMAKLHLEQPDDVVDNKPFWEEVLKTKQKELKRLCYEEELDKFISKCF